MNSLYLLIPLSIVLVALAAVVFIVAIRKGQFDDLDRQQNRMPDE